MKYIKATIRPSKLADVTDALLKVGVVGITVTEVKGFGRQKGQSELYRGAEYQTDFVPKLQIEIALEDGVADAAVEAIQGVARTGRMGDGRIFVLLLDTAVRIRTNERGADAL